MNQTTAATTRKRRARRGDIVTLELQMTPENGFVPEPLFDSSGRVQFVLGWGNYLPGLHELVEGCYEGETVTGVSVDAGWGSRNKDLIVSVPKSKVDELGVPIHVGTSLKLAGGIQVTVQEIRRNTVVLDANPPLAGSSYACTFTVLAIDDCPNLNGFSGAPDSPMGGGRYQVATFALGCFWGSELAYMRQPGVVGTRAGYSQGISANPTYQDVCEGKSKHREAVLVVYDSTVVSYQELVDLAFERLAKTTSSFDLSHLFDQGGEESIQYRHGFYIHNPEQYEIAKSAVDANQNKYRIELLEATTFYDAEEHHQQYLYKGGQSARKQARDSIMCYG